jgi:hypothetical protein
MNEKRMWIVGGLLFIVAAIVSLIGENIAMAGAFAAIGLLFLATPSYMDRKNRT